MAKREQPHKKEVNKVLTELKFHRKASTSNVPNVPQKVIKKESSVAESESSGLSHLAGDVDRWIHGSATTVTRNLPEVSSNVTLRNEPVVRSAGVQSSRHQHQRPTIISGINLGFGPCYALGMMLLDFETRAGGRSIAAIVNILCFLASQVHQVCLGCMLDARRTLQLSLSPDTFATQMCALAMDALLVAYALGFVTLAAYQMTVGA